MLLRLWPYLGRSEPQNSLVRLQNREVTVHQTWNLISFEFDVCYQFDQLKMWFEHTDKVWYSEPEPCLPTDICVQPHRYLQSLSAHRTHDPPLQVCGSRSSSLWYSYFCGVQLKLRGNAATRPSFTCSSCNVCSRRAHVWCCIIFITG